MRIVTHLGSFRGESAFATWAYRVAANYLLTTRKRRAEREEPTFARFAEQLDEGLAPAVPGPAADVERRLLVVEVKLGCTQGMLLCLDRDHRLAYILGEAEDLASREAGDIVGISPAAFRKRLSRARGRLHGFMARKCGLVNPANPCRCGRRVEHAVRVGRVDPDRLLFATHPARRQAGCDHPGCRGGTGALAQRSRLASGPPRLRGARNGRNVCPGPARPDAAVAGVGGLMARRRRCRAGRRTGAPRHRTPGASRGWSLSAR